MDPRCFVDHFNALSHVIQNINVNVQHLQHAVSDICLNQQRESVLESVMLDNFHKLTKSVDRIEKHAVGKIPDSMSLCQPKMVLSSPLSAAEVSPIKHQWQM